MLKISIIKTGLDLKLWEEYINENETPQACPYFKAGDEFIISDFQMPSSFCPWAWQDLYYRLYAMSKGASMLPWYKEENITLASCSDATRPVVFRIERVMP